MASTHALKLGVSLSGSRKSVRSLEPVRCLGQLTKKNTASANKIARVFKRAFGASLLEIIEKNLWRPTDGVLPELVQFCKLVVS